MRILVVGPSGCGKYTAIRRMMPVITASNHCNYPGLQQDTYFLQIRGVTVSVVDLAEDASKENFVKACSDIDGAIVFVGHPGQKFGKTIGKAAPLAKIRYINYNGIKLADVDMPRITITNGDSLQSHIEELIDSIRAPELTPQIQVPVKVDCQEMWLLSTPTDGEHQMYRNMAQVHEEVARQFTFRIQYDGVPYYGFREESGENHAYATRDACVAAIIQEGLVRVEKVTLHL